MQCDTDGDSLVWSWKAHDETADAFADIAGDPRDQSPDPHRNRRDNTPTGTCCVVYVFKQNRIPNSGAAFFEMVAEPAV